MSLLNAKTAASASLMVFFAGAAARAQTVDPSPQAEPHIEGQSYFDGARQKVQRDRVAIFQWEQQRLARDFKVNGFNVVCPFDLETQRAIPDGVAAITYGGLDAQAMTQFLRHSGRNTEFVRRNNRFIEIDIDLPNPKHHRFYMDAKGQATQINEPSVRQEFIQRHARGDLDLTGVTETSLENLFARLEPVAMKLCFSGS